MTIYSIKLRCWLITVFVFLFVFRASSRGAQDNDQLQGIVENVKANELLYRNFEAIRRRVYRFNDSAGLETLPALDKIMEARSRCVRQGDLIYIEETQSATQLSDKEVGFTSIQGYDGTFTRSVNQVANIHHGRNEGCELFRPHTWFHRPLLCFPLSLWLKGGEELQKHPSRSFQDLYLIVRVVKTESVDGIACFKIRADAHAANAKGKLLFWREVWLAPERNYLPVKMVGYDHWSSTIPAALGTFDDFREIQPGVWLPFHYKHTVFDGPAAKGGKQIWRNQEEHFIDKYDPEPKYDISLFRDIRIPDGMLVYEFKDGVIIRSYVAGQWEPGRLSKQSSWILLVGVISVLFAFAGGFLYWRRKRRASRLARRQARTEA